VKEKPASLEFNKLVVQPVVIERDADGRITGERIFDPTPIHTEEQAVEFMRTLRSSIDIMNLELATEPIVETRFVPDGD
jgi:hypothetical protein